MGRESPYMWTAEAAERLGVSETTVREWMDSGRLKGMKLPGSGYRRYLRESVERVRAEMRGESAP
jgi:DNA repair protein RadD